MATAKRLYLYSVSATGLGMALVGAVAMLHLLLNRAGLGPQNYSNSSFGSDADRDLLSIAIAVGVVGLVLWLSHWAIAERMVKALGDAAAAERASIVRSVFFAIAMSILLATAATLAVSLLSDVIANVLNATVSYSTALIDDSWSVATIVIFLGVWAYHAWIRARDVRRGTPINGAAAWVSRFYLYGAAFVGLLSVLGALSSIINTVAAEIALPHATTTSDFSGVYNLQLLTGSTAPDWVRPTVAAIVGIVIWGAVWLSHWLYSNRLRSDQGVPSDRSIAERTSRVRLAFLMVVVLWSVSSIAAGIASGLGMLFATALGMKSDNIPLWFEIVVPPLAALPAVAAWWLHRRRALSEAPVGPVGVSARRIASYVTAWVGLGLIADGLMEGLSTIFGKWLPGAASASSDAFSDDLWKYALGLSFGFLVAGLVFWAWPWFSSQRRRNAPDSAEVGSSARSFSLAEILYLYLKLGFGLSEPDLATTISLPLALLITSALLFGYHALVMRGDARGPRPPRGMEFAPSPFAPMPPFFGATAAAPEAPAAPEALAAPAAHATAAPDQPAAPEAPVAQSEPTPPTA
jgi:hypothetical protein